MNRKSTDVHGSIAGYYYQILLACRELTSDQDLLSVGIEAGADVRIIKNKDRRSSVEAKFYKGNIGKFDLSIYKTVDNFYRNSYGDETLTFETNTKPTRTCKTFFDTWNGSLSSAEKIAFVKECILRRSIEADDQIKKLFAGFKIRNKANINGNAGAM